MPNVKVCLCLPIAIEITVEPNDSNRIIVQKLLLSINNNISNINLSNIKYILYNNNIIHENDDIFDIMNNECIYVVLKCESENNILPIFDRLIDLYNIYYPRHSALLQYIFHFIFSESSLLNTTPLNTPLNSPSTTLSIEDIERLQKIKFSELNYIFGNENKYNICPISNENITNNTDIIILPCGHYFIDIHITMWLNQYNKICPTCRIPVNVNDNDNDNDNDNYDDDDNYDNNNIEFEFFDL